MADLLSDNQDVMDALLRAISDPGSVLPRAPLESLPSWQRRAVLEHAAPYITADQATENEGFRAYQAGLTAGRAEGAAAERERILVPDETVHTDGSIGPDSVPAEYSQDPAYWYRRWLFAMKGLDAEAYERLCGWPKAAAGERERLLTVIAERFKTVLADPGNGYLLDAVPWALLRDYLAAPRADLLTGEGP